MEVTNYNPCNFIVQCTNKQHNPPFITWNRIFKTQLNVGRELSKAKPDVVRRVFVQAKPWGMLSSGEFVRECVCVCGGEKGSEGRGVHYWDGTTRRATAVVRSYGKLGEALCSQVGGRGSRVYVLWGWGQRQGRWGWDWSYSRGRYCVARLTVRVHEVSQLRWPLTPKPAPQPIRSRMRLKNNATHWLKLLPQCSSKLACSNLTSELHGAKFTVSGHKAGFPEREVLLGQLNPLLRINREIIWNIDYICYFI